MPQMFSRRWNATSLRTKMTAVSVFLLTLGLVIAGVGSATVLRNYLTDQVDKRLTFEIQHLDLAIFQFDTIDSCSIAAQPTIYFVAIYSTDGAILCSNESATSGRPNMTVLKPDKAQNSSPFTVPGVAKNTQWRAVTVVGTYQGNLLPIIVAQPLDDTDGVVAQFAAIFLFFGLTVVILGGALTRLLVTSTFSPLREVEATAARFAAGDFTQRLGGATPNTEVGRLNRSLNSMLNRIDKAFADRAKTIEQMRRFVGDASHELRTPLVSVRGYAELYRMGALPDKEAVAQAMERIEKEAIRMGELVTDLLELARIDEAKPLQLAEVDLVPLARDAALDAMASRPDRTVSVVITNSASEVLEDQLTDAAPIPEINPPVAQATGPIRFAGATIARLRGRSRRNLKIDPATIEVPIAVTPSTTAVIVAEENKIRQVLTNLMGNAIRFTPDGSPIEIGVEVDEARNIAILSVIDHGEGIPEQIRDKIFQRFWRADSSRNRDTGGSGLGLAIVASIVNAHKGEIEVVETLGGGATFRVVLPVLQQAPEITQPTEP